MAEGFSEPTPRQSPFSAPVGGQVFLSGGRTPDFRKESSLYRVHSLNVYSETWRERQVARAPPPGVYLGASASSGQYLYCFGGYDGSAWRNTLYQLDTTSATMKWTQLTTPDFSSGPMKKDGGGMIAYGSHLILFGGYGVPCAPTQPGAEFVKDHYYADGCGWTNELHVFDVTEGEAILCHYIYRVYCSTGIPVKFKWGTLYSWPSCSCPTLSHTAAMQYLSIRTLLLCIIIHF